MELTGPLACGYTPPGSTRCIWSTMSAWHWVLKAPLIQQTHKSKLLLLLLDTRATWRRTSFLPRLLLLNPVGVVLVALLVVALSRGLQSVE